MNDYAIIYYTIKYIILHNTGIIPYDDVTSCSSNVTWSISTWSHLMSYRFRCVSDLRQGFAAVQEVSSKMKMNMSLEQFCYSAKQSLLPISRKQLHDPSLWPDRPRWNRKRTLAYWMSRALQNLQFRNETARDLHVFRICTNLGKLPSSQIILGRCHQVSLLCSKAKRFQNVLCPSETEKIWKPTATAQGKTAGCPPLCRSACRSCVQKTSRAKHFDLAKRTRMTEYLDLWILRA